MSIYVTDTPRSCWGYLTVTRKNGNDDRKTLSGVESYNNTIC